MAAQAVTTWLRSGNLPGSIHEPESHSGVTKNIRDNPSSHTAGAVSGHGRGQPRGLQVLIQWHLKDIQGARDLHLQVSRPTQRVKTETSLIYAEKRIVS